MPELRAERRRIAVVAAVIQQADGRFLLAQRPPGKPYAGYWEFPGGKVEAGESPESALSRELHEELGIETLTAHPWLIREFDYPHADVRLHFFRVRAWRGDPQGREDQAFAWQRVDAIDVAPLLPANGPIMRALALPETYGITGFKPAEYPAALDRIERAMGEGLRLLQVRGKDWPPQLFESFAAATVTRARSLGARVLVNADIELALRSGADGVHLTASQLLAMKQRPALPLVGASCHDRVELQRAEDLGVDFAVLGPVQPTPTHPDALPLGWQGFRSIAADTTIPVFALGGLHEGDRQQALDAGAHGLAMLRGAWPAA